VDAFSEELTEAPESELAYAMRAASWLNFGKTKDALSDVLEALRVSPNFGYAHYILSCVETNRGRSWKAEAAVREALRLEPRAEYFFRLAEIYNVRGLYSECLGILGEGLALDPWDTNCLMLRAKCLSALGRQQDAKECLSAVLSTNPEDPAAHQALGKLTLEIGSAEHARDSLREARRLNPISHNDRNALAAAYGRMIWPLSLCEPFRIRYEHWLPSRRWMFLASTATVLLLISCICYPHWYVSVPVFLIAFNLVAMSITFDMFATAVGKFVYKKDLDIKWYRLLPELFRFVFPVLLHVFVLSFMAIVCACAPILAVLILGFIVNFELLLLIVRSRFLKQLGFMVIAVLGVFIPLGMSASFAIDAPLTIAVLLCWSISLGFSYLLSVHLR
jgi:tetratricopeptide (TPR) repeat protein